MKYIFSRDIGKILKIKQRIFLFLDFDGTLSPLVKTPQSARIDPKIKGILRALSRKKSVVLGVISGRSLTDVRKRAGFSRILYAGNHGLEVYFQGKRQLVKKKACLPGSKILRSVKKTLKAGFQDINGVVFEDKGVSLAVHYRKVQSRLQGRVKAVFQEAAGPFLKNKQFTVTAGKKVLEVRPNFAYGKADAVAFFERKLNKKKGEPTVFIGDDITDEDVFKSLGRADIGIRVGKSRKSQAGYFVKNINEVRVLLKKILELTPG